MKQSSLLSLLFSLALSLLHLLKCESLRSQNSVGNSRLFFPTHQQQDEEYEVYQQQRKRGRRSCRLLLTSSSAYICITAGEVQCDFFFFGEKLPMLCPLCVQTCPIFKKNKNKHFSTVSCTCPRESNACPYSTHVQDGYVSFQTCPCFLDHNQKEFWLTDFISLSKLFTFLVDFRLELSQCTTELNISRNFKECHYNFLSHSINRI